MKLWASLWTRERDRPATRAAQQVLPGCGIKRRVEGFEKPQGPRAGTPASAQAAAGARPSTGVRRCAAAPHLAAPLAARRRLDRQPHPNGGAGSRQPVPGAAPLLYALPPRAVGGAPTPAAAARRRFNGARCPLQPGAAGAWLPLSGSTLCCGCSFLACLRWRRAVCKGQLVKKLGQPSGCARVLPAARCKPPPPHPTCRGSPSCRPLRWAPSSQPARTAPSVSSPTPAESCEFPGCRSAHPSCIRAPHGSRPLAAAEASPRAVSHAAARVIPPLHASSAHPHPAQPHPHPTPCPLPLPTPRRQGRAAAAQPRPAGAVPRAPFSPGGAALGVRRDAHARDRRPPEHAAPGQHDAHRPGEPASCLSLSLSRARVCDCASACAWSLQGQARRVYTCCTVCALTGAGPLDWCGSRV